MSDLTPIPAEQRHAYYDALLAGRAEAERLGYGLMDDRVFAAFYRALYGPMLAAARADERAKVAEEIAAAYARGYGRGRDDEAAGMPVRPVEAVAEPISAPPESDRTSEGSQARSGRRPGGLVLPPQARLYDPAVDGPIQRIADDRDDRQEQ